jgi:CheY-like chemotaxis protein
MPRLLLVDDNQRIHQIVETLLTATDIELTCASSGAEALEKVAESGPFDVALLDTTMQGMDGWELLAALRRDPASARMPIAMMAGVLDAVDPEMVEKAPIQGFLKKPVELRDLADRVRILLDTPVELPEPELPAEPAPTFETQPYFKLSDHPLPGTSDLLLLEPGDLMLEEEAAPESESSPEPEPEPIPATEAEPAMESLDLEELDLESLKGLNMEPMGEAMPVPEFLGEAPTVENVVEVPDFGPEDDFGGNTLDLGVVTDELPDLGANLEFGEEASAPALPALEPEPESDPAMRFEPATSLPDDWSDDSESLLGMTEEPAWMERTTPVQLPEPPAPSPMESHSDFDSDVFREQDVNPLPLTGYLPELPEAITQVAPLEPIHSELLPDASTSREIEALPEPAHSPEPEPEHVPEPTHVPEPEHVPQPEPVPEPAPAGSTPAADPLAVLLSDPVLMDRLAKAVASRLGDQVLREIAWEIMPELADRHNRN